MDRKHKLLMSLFASIGALVISLVTFECYLRFSTDKHWIQRDWLYLQGDFSLKYIFWLKSWCTRYPLACTNDLENVVPFPLETYPKVTNSDCMKIAFIGDSFTQIIGVDPDLGYPAVFSKTLSEHIGRCVTNIRVATADTGMDQQLAFFSDVVGKIQPDFVVWQTFANDYYDNVEKALYKIDSNDQLFRIIPWNNSIYLGGLFNYLPSFFVHSYVGNTINKYLDTRDLFRFNAIDVSKMENIVEYNERKIPLLINQMENLAGINNFEFLITSTPLEIKYDGLGGEKTYVQAYDLFDTSLEEVLLKSNKYVPMSYLLAEPEGLGLKAENEKLFLANESPLAIGERHLSKEGNIIFGSYLIENFLVKKETYKILQ